MFECIGILSEILFKKHNATGVDEANKQGHAPHNKKPEETK